MPNGEIDELKDKFVECLSPIKIYLFGSFAEGKQNDNSDFDFYIVVNDSEKDIVDLTIRAYKSIRKIKQRPVDIVVSTRQRFEERKEIPSVENEVVSKGVLIYGE